MTERGVKLSTFITTHVEEILHEWEANATRRVKAGDRGSIAPLRDHLGELLQTIARDIDAPAAAAPRGSGRTSEHDEASDVEAVGEKHGAGRAEQGFTLQQLVSEFPVLRSCVTRRWLQTTDATQPSDVEDLARFNEALDLAFMKSVGEFTARINRAREVFLGILGHDLRNPLSTIIMAAKMLLEEKLGESETREMVQRIVLTAERMHQMVMDLLDFTRARLGNMPVTLRPFDLAQTVRAVVDEFSTSHPNRAVRVHVTGDLRGKWDDARIGQAVSNLLGNAMHHGEKDAPIDVSARGDDAEVLISVHNEGPPIPPDKQQMIFEPLMGAAGDKGGRDPNHLGLGLYIAKAIAVGHGGRIDVESSAERGTTFTIRVPRAT